MRVLLLMLLLVVGINASVCGAMLAADPDGSTLRLPASLLDQTPFSNFFVPGILLAGLVGIPNLVAFLICLPKQGPHYGWAIGAGFLLSGWIVAQNLLLETVSWLHLIYLGIGIMIILISWQLMGRWAV